ncbi:hypothetical protein ACQ4WX_19845 [Streptomyces lasalocidi]
MHAHTTVSAPVSRSWAIPAASRSCEAHLAQRVHPVRVLADVGVDQVQPDVAAEELLDARVVVLAGVAGVEESECGHVRPFPYS